MQKKLAIGRQVTAWSMIALLAGLGLGLVGQWAAREPIAWLAEAVRPLASAWINALQMTVIPLVVTQILSALVRSERIGNLGSLGGRTAALFLVMLLSAGMFSLTVTPLILQWYTPPPGIASAMHVESIPPSMREAAQAGHVRIGDHLAGIIPTNAFAAAARGELLPILVFTILFGAAASRLPDDTRRPLAELVKSLDAAMTVLIRWILLAAPIGVFALILGLTIEIGSAAVGFLLAYILGVSTLLIAALFLLYPVTVIFGRVSLRRFARAVAPAQIVAASTQSSLASLAALVQGGRDSLKLPEAGTAFVLPLAVSSFRLNQAISPMFRFLLLAHVFGVSLSTAQCVTFLATAILLSVSVAGLPRGGGGFRTLPLYIAAGIPIEAYALVEAVHTIPDVLMTITNVTADMSVATIVTRRQRSVPAVAKTLERLVPVGEVAS